MNPAKPVEVKSSTKANKRKRSSRKRTEDRMDHIYQSIRQTEDMLTQLYLLPEDLVKEYKALIQKAWGNLIHERTGRKEEIVKAI